MKRDAVNWFEIDKEGLAKILQKRGKVFALYELISNAWDTKAKNVTVTIDPVPNTPKAVVKVEDDDPTGFSNLTHAFTLFAESEKKSDATKRGRFNLGEKLVLAICDSAEIASTSGTVVFDKDGRHTKRGTREKGSQFVGSLRLTRAEVDECLAELRRLIPPEGIETTINGDLLPRRKRLRGFEATLPTEISDDEGNLHRTERKTLIEVYEPGPDEQGTLYEMGVPVVGTEDRWHVNIMQKVPLNMDRDNVTPAFLNKVRVAVVNQMKDQLTEAEANTPLVREAAASPDASPAAVEKILDLRFGSKRVAHDPNDPESNARAVAEGYTLVHGGMMGKGEWKNAKDHGLLLPSSQVTPAPKPYSEDGEILKTLDEQKWTPAMRQVVEYSKWVAKRLMGVTVSVQIASEVTWKYGATYGPRGPAHGQLVFNLGRLGHKFFDAGRTKALNTLLIHEFGHHYELNHLSEKYHDALCSLGARMAELHLDDPVGVTAWFSPKDV